MVSREEVHKLYKDFVELYKEQEHKFKSFEFGGSDEMDDVLDVFRGCGGSELQIALSECFYGIIKELNDNYDKIKVEGKIDDSGCTLTAKLDVDFNEDVRSRLGKLRSYKVGLFNDDDGSFEQFVLFYTMKSKLEDMIESDWKELEQELKNALVVVDADMNTLYEELVHEAKYMLAKIHHEGLGIFFEDLEHIIYPHYENAMEIYNTLSEEKREIVKKSHVKGFDGNYDEWVELLLYEHESLADIYKLEEHVIELQAD